MHCADLNGIKKKDYVVEKYNIRTNRFYTDTEQKYSLIDAYKNGHMYLIHILNGLPDSLFKNLTEFYGSFDATTDTIPDRLSLHFALNRVVSPHGRGNWETNSYGIIVNARDVLDTLFGAEEDDTVIVSGTSYADKEVYFIIPKDDRINLETNPLLGSYVGKLTADLLIAAGVPKENIFDYEVPSKELTDLYDQKLKSKSIDFSKDEMMSYITNMCETIGDKCPYYKELVTKMQTLRDTTTKVIYQIFKKKNLGIFLLDDTNNNDTYKVIDPVAQTHCTINRDEIQFPKSADIKGDDNVLDDHPTALIKELKTDIKLNRSQQINPFDPSSHPYGKLIKMLEDINQNVIYNSDRGDLNKTVGDNVITPLKNILNAVGDRYLEHFYTDSTVKKSFVDLIYNSIKYIETDDYVYITKAEEIAKKINANLKQTGGVEYYKKKYHKYKYLYLTACDAHRKN